LEIEKVIRQLKQNATMRLKEENIHPFAEFEGPPTPWAESCWKVFLNHEEFLRKAIRYVEENPVKEGKKPQHWSFVRSYDGQH
jgi:REP element-mobilizing transposase RayT